MKIHSFRNGRFSSAQFFFFGQVPLNSNCTTCAPARPAISIEPSVLCESTTKISSAHAIEERQRGRFSASFRIGTINETGTRSSLAAIRKLQPRAMHSEKRKIRHLRVATRHGTPIEKLEPIRAEQRRNGVAAVAVEIDDFHSLLCEEAGSA